MAILYWFFVIILGYAALGVWVANVSSALRRKRTSLAIALLALPPVLLIAAPWMAAAFRGVLIAGGLFVLTLILVRLLNPGEPILPRRETTPAILHLVLVTGSALFLIPFVWMVVTSLKEDSQLAIFPPEWIPTQQVMVQYQGHEHGLVKVDVDGKSVYGIVLKTNADGTSQVLAPATIEVVPPDAAAADPMQAMVQPSDLPIVKGPAVPTHSAGNKKPAASSVITPSSPSSLGGGGLPSTPRLLTLTATDVTEVRHPSPVWKNYPDALKFLPPSSHFGLVNLQNTLIIALLSVVGTVLSSSLVAYGFARLRWPGRDWVFGLLLATMMLPDAVTMMPRFLIFRSLGWIDSLRPLWVPSFFASAFNVFLLRQFFMGIPKELEEAARIDGCSYLGTYWRIMMPMIKPSLAAVAIMSLLNSWKDFLNPLIYISSPEKMPVSYVLQLYNSAHGGEPQLLMAATTLVILPVMILFFFTQRYFIEGVSLTGLGGR
jgi:multiple sugar transport system permease protein